VAGENLVEVKLTKRELKALAKYVIKPYLSGYIEPKPIPKIVMAAIRKLTPDLVDTELERQIQREAEHLANREVELDEEYWRVKAKYDFESARIWNIQRRIETRLRERRLEPLRKKLDAIHKKYVEANIKKLKKLAQKQVEVECRGL